MKKVSKLFLILGLVFNGIACLTYLILAIVFLRQANSYSSVLYDIHPSSYYYDEYSYYSGYYKGLSVWMLILLMLYVGKIIFNSYSLASVHKMEYSDDISLGYKICILIFVDIVAGILLLCWNEKRPLKNSINDSNFSNFIEVNNSTKYSSDNKQALQNESVDNKENLQKESAVKKGNSFNYDALVKLKELLDMGVITQEEFENKKKEYL